MPSDEFLAPAGRVLDSMLSEHQCEGWLEGYLLDGGMGSATVTRHSSTSSIRCSTSCQVVGNHLAPAVAAQDRLAQLPARLACLASGSQWLHAPGPRFPRRRDEQEGRNRSGLPSSRRELPAVGDGRFACVDVIDRLPQTGDKGLYLKQQLQGKLIEHKREL